MQHFEFMKKYLFLSLLLLLAMATSCKSYKDIPYFSSIPSDDSVYVKGFDIEGAKYEPLLIKPDDILQVNIDIMDNKLSAVTAQSNASASLDAETRGATGYLVDQNGEINLPLLGIVKAAGKTTNQIKEEIQEKAASIYRNPVVNVRLSNFAISVLGEVNKPGTYFIKGERASILDALGLAGDMTIYGRRDNVMLLRKTDNGQKIYRFDLNDEYALSLPFFYLQQNDVLYVQPSNAKAAQTDSQRMQWLSITASLATVIAVFASRLIR